MRLIDADALKETELDFDTDDDCTLFCDAIDNAPTIEAEPVRHGHWIGIQFNEFFKCSVCGDLTDWDAYDYCPYCGAKMDGDPDA